MTAIQFKTQTVKANRPYYPGETVPYTLTPSEHFNAVLVSWPTARRYSNETNYYTIQTGSSDRVNMPDYKPWKKSLAQDLNTASQYFLGRRMSHRNDSLAAYESLERTTGDIPEAVIMTAVRMIITNHNARIRKGIEGHRHPFYKALAPIAKGMMKSYFTDFSHHDSLHFGTYNPLAALWIVSPSNTNLYTSSHAEVITGTPQTITGILQAARYGSKARRYFYIEATGPDKANVKEIGVDDLPFYVNELVKAGRRQQEQRKQTDNAPL